MLICFFDSEGVVYKELMPQGQTVSQQYYHEVLECLRKRVHHVWPEIVDAWTLHHGNAVILPSPWTNFWPKRVFQWFHSLHNRLIWVCVTSSFSWNSNSTSKVVILELWTTFKRSWQTNCRQFHMKTSSTATRSGRNISGGVRLPKGTTLRRIMLICSYC